MRVLLSYTHSSCTANNYLGMHHAHISSFKMQNEAEWIGSRISVGSAADIVKLTHYKWICNPQVDLNCVYCYSSGVCVCVRVYFSVSAQLHLFLSLTLLSILLLDHMPLILLLTKAQCFPYKCNGIIGDLQRVQLFLSCTLG